MRAQLGVIGVLASGLADAEESYTFTTIVQNLWFLPTTIYCVKPIKFQGMDVIPLEFLKAVLPEPGDLGENYTGETSIGCQIKGIKDGKDGIVYKNTLAACTHRKIPVLIFNVRE